MATKTKKSSRPAASRAQRYKSKLNTRSLSRKLDGIKAAPKDGPNLSLRLRNREAKRAVTKAAAKANMTINTWSCEVLERAAAASA